MNKTFTHTNRYGDVFTFTELEDGNIQMSGNFEYCRTGYANVYGPAYNQYEKDGGGLSYTDFTKAVHDYDSEKGEWVYPEYVKLVETDYDKINMLDPSGGPYLSAGMKLMGNRYIKEFKRNEDGWLIITEER